MSPTDILRTWKTIAVVGLSPKKIRPSYGVSEYMQSHGYRIVPVNPGHAEILGERCYARLEDIPQPVDIVNVFRRSEECGPVIDSAIAIGAKCIWLQEGIEHHDGATKARAAGLEVVMDRCVLKEHRKLR
ncbi:MAG: CoA-binding protein [Bryobacteraceae bacterium]|nr:CoA-binding protein [Bryobacteraceae bacterium]